MTRDSTKWFTWGFSGRYGAGAGRGGAAEPGTHHTHHGAGAGRGGAAEPGTHHTHHGAGAGRGGAAEPGTHHTHHGARGGRAAERGTHCGPFGKIAG